MVTIRISSLMLPRWTTNPVIRMCVKTPASSFHSLQEMSRVIAAGGRVEGPYIRIPDGGLAVSRAFGDYPFKIPREGNPKHRMVRQSIIHPQIFTCHRSVRRRTFKSAQCKTGRRYFCAVMALLKALPFPQQRFNQ